MRNTTSQSFRWRRFAFPIGLCAVELALLLISLGMPRRKMFVAGSLVYVGACFLLWLMFAGCPSLHSKTLQTIDKRGKRFLILSVIVMILLCTLPMGISPVQNGTVESFRNQYEEMAESLLQGRLDLVDHEVAPQLLEMENPYDHDARAELNFWYEWDHSFYNGKYYMYFGVVPVILLFLPYRVLTGVALAGYHATQIFTAALIIGLFMLLYHLSSVYFKKMTIGMYMALSAATAAMCCWHATSTPTLYCTANASALCLMVWSLYFFAKAVFPNEKGRKYTENQQLALAAVGSLLGALTFGCRPPVGLANLLVLPMLWVFLRGRRLSWKLTGKLALAALPYAIVAALLMLYNVKRFDNPFEFGQSYQLTLADQSNYMAFSNVSSIGMLAKNVGQQFFQWFPITKEFPYIQPAGMLWNYPFLILGAGAVLPSVRKQMRRAQITTMALCLVLTAALIMVMNVFWSPVLFVRYQMDVSYLVGIACYLAIGCMGEAVASNRGIKRLSRLITGFALVTIALCMVLFLHPFDHNPSWSIPGFSHKVQQVLALGLLD